MSSHHARGQHAQPEAAQAAHQVLGQHGEAFLQAVVSRQADFELLKRLDMAVVTSDQVSADFVLQQGVDATPGNTGLTADQKLIAGHHHARVHVFADSDRGGKIGALPLIVAKFLLGALREFRGRKLAIARFLAAACRHAVEQLPSLGEQRFGHAPVDLQAFGQESRCVDVREQGNLPIELSLSLSEQVRQRRIVDPLDTGKGRRAWSYLPGQRRVKVAPDLAHDTPNPGTSGATTFDDTYIFNGSMERFDFKLLGKREMYIPYNAYRMAYHSKAADLLQPNFLNPDLVRWELHRVWVVEATLSDGKRHVYSKRTFYLDEDSWAAVASDEYDGRGELYRAGFAYVTPSYEVPAPVSNVHGHYDFVAGAYSLTAYTSETGGFRYSEPLPSRHWTPDSLAGTGIR